MSEYLIEWQEEHEYMKEIIADIYKGSSHFYIVIEKQRILQFFKKLMMDLPKNEIELKQIINQQTQVSDLLNFSQLGNKTLTNILSGRTKTLSTVKQIVLELFEEVQSEFSSDMQPDLEITINGETVENTITPHIILIMNSLYSTVSGSIRSTYGKWVEIYYLQMVCKALDADWVENQAINLTNYFESERRLHAIHGNKWYITENKLVKSSRSEKRGREIDLLIGTYDESIFVPLLAIEFTLGGRGNPTAAVNKAKSIGSFSSVLPDSLIFFGFDLASDKIRNDIPSDVETIFFKEKKETEPISIIYEKLEKRANDLDLDIHLPSKEEVIENFSNIVRDNCY